MKNKLKKAAELIAAPQRKRLSQFQNKHSGECCYIFGDGASLKWFDLRAFSDYPVFTLSFLLFHNQAKNLNIKYGVLTDTYYFYPYYKLHLPPYTYWRNKIQLAYRSKIKSHNKADYFLSIAAYPVLRGSNVFYPFKYLANDELSRKLKLANLEQFHGSLRTAISLAIYMGFKKIYLVGCDYTHEMSKIGHWYEVGEGENQKVSEYNKDFFTVAREFSEIVTVTLSGDGSVLPGETYEEHTGKLPIYKENVDLTSDEYLRLLSTWPGYKIF